MIPLLLLAILITLLHAWPIALAVGAVLLVLAAIIQILFVMFQMVRGILDFCALPAAEKRARCVASWAYSRKDFRAAGYGLLVLVALFVGSILVNWAYGWTL